jgi:hypothetical protein
LKLSSRCDDAIFELALVNCDYMYILIAGGKSDPYFEIRSAFGRGYVSPSTMQGKEPYQGKHNDKPLYKSEYVSKDLNPIWKAQALDLNR